MPRPSTPEASQSKSPRACTMKEIESRRLRKARRTPSPLRVVAEPLDVVDVPHIAQSSSCPLPSSVMRRQST